jgi:2-methylcitrate dehydratase PrpD
VSPLQAALVNGTSSHVLDFDDVNATLIGHPSVAMLGALLALAESLHSSGPEFLCAFVAGYETACRVAAAVGPLSYARRVSPPPQVEIATPRLHWSNRRRAGTS